MSVETTALDSKFWRVFERTLGVQLERTRVSVKDLEEWDSLRHVELIFELEEAFDLNILPDDIVKLYSDTDVILSYIRKSTGDKA